MTSTPSTSTPLAPATASAPHFRPRPWIAALLSVLLAGLGHLYAGRLGRAAIALIGMYASLITLLLLSFAVPLAPLRVALLAMAMGGPFVLIPLDAARVARRADDAVRRPYQRWYALLATWLLGVFFVQGPAYDWIRANVVEAIRTPGGAMAPTILPGDLAFASPRRRAVVQRGDVVMYSVPGDGFRYVHRVVGLPGDTVAMRAFRLVVNGASPSWAHAITTDSAGAAESDPAFAWQRDRLPAGHDASSYRPTYGTWGPVVLRQDEYFVLGDDAANSLDSRHRGPVRTDAIVGRPVWVYFSRDAERGVIRWSRIGQAIE